MRSRVLAVALCASFASAGCLRLTEPTGPSAPPIAARAFAGEDARVSSRGFFPLATGNRWRYSFTHAVTGPGVPGGRLVWAQGTLTIELVGRMQVGAWEYFLARNTSTTTLTGNGFTITLIDTVGYRQDSRGFYELYPLSGVSLDAAGSNADTPARLGSMPGPGWWDRQLSQVARREAQMLSYPLHPGATWTIGDPIQATVEGIDVLQLPMGRAPAYRVNTFAEGVSDHQILTWWSRQGLLREYRFDRQECLDPICPPPDTFSEDILTVEEIHLESPALGK